MCQNCTRKIWKWIRNGSEMYHNFKMCQKAVILTVWKLSDICQKYKFWHFIESFLLKPWNISRKHSGQKTIRKLSNDTFLTHLYSWSETFTFKKTARYQSSWFFWQSSETLRYGMEKGESTVVYLTVFWQVFGSDIWVLFKAYLTVNWHSFVTVLWRISDSFQTHIWQIYSFHVSLLMFGFVTLVATFPSVTVEERLVFYWCWWIIDV